jgi:hypothetical protein
VFWVIERSEEFSGDAKIIWGDCLVMMKESTISMTCILVSFSSDSGVWIKKKT